MNVEPHIKNEILGNIQRYQPAKETLRTHFLDVPILGFAAWSGTGKTTLLTKIIPMFRARGFRLGIVKHVHHSFEIDKPGKDSYKFRQAGANQVIAASNERVAYIREIESPSRKPRLVDALESLDIAEIDLIFIEGYKHERIPKIELSRQAINRAPLYPNDSSIFAIASDDPCTGNLPITSMDINNPEEITSFIIDWLHNTARLNANQ